MTDEQLAELKRLASEATPDLPDSIRLPLHSLKADVAYLIGGVAADGSTASMVTHSIGDRLSQIEIASYALITEVERLRKALKPFADEAEWFDTEEGEAHSFFDDRKVKGQFKIGEFRAARAALEKP